MPFRCLLANSKRVVMCLFTEEWLPSGHSTIRPDWWSAAEMVVLLEGSPISKEELWSSVRVTIGFLVTYLTKTFLHSAQFGRAASSSKSLGGSKLLPIKNDGGLCILGDLQCCRLFLVPFPRWTVNCGTLYRQVCAFPNHVQSIEFTTAGLQSSCRNISRMINGNRMHLSSI